MRGKQLCVGSSYAWEETDKQKRSLKIKLPFLQGWGGVVEGVWSLFKKWVNIGSTSALSDNEVVRQYRPGSVGRASC